MVVKTSNAPELLQTAVAKILVQPLEAKSVFLSSGPTIFNTSSPLRIPKLGGPVDVTWVGESEEIPDDEDVDFDEVSLMPSTMKSLKIIVRASNEMFRQSVVSLDAAIQQRLVTDVAAKLDAQLFSASGDGVTTPKGLFAYSGTQNVPVGGPLTYDSLLAAWGAALEANVSMSTLKWVMKPREFMTLKGLKDADERYLAQPDVTADGVFRAFGVPIVVTPRVPDTTGGTPTGRRAGRFLADRGGP